MCDDDFLGAPDEDDDESVSSDGNSPTSGERPLFGLGQLRLLSRRRRLPLLTPGWFGVEDVARIVGVAGDIEFVQEDPRGTSYHLPGEVLHVLPGDLYSWRLLDVWDWAVEQELNSFWAEGWD